MTAAVALDLFTERPPRSSLVPAKCPFDFADVDPNGGQLQRVLGPPIFPAWCAEYSVVTDTRPCPHCRKRIGAAETQVSVSVIPDRADPRRYDLRWAHELCAVEKAGLKVTSMATAMATRDMPDCALCGESYEAHGRYITTIWDSWCAVDLPNGDLQWYRPAAPFRSGNWPYRLIVDSPRYSPNGVYAETEDEAIERLKQEAAA